jgi:hypothetical protein
MALTKPQFYLTLLLVVGFVAIGLMRIGEDLYNSPNIALDSRSEKYIEDYTSLIVDEGIDTLWEKNTGDYKTENLLESESNASADLTSGELGVLFYNKNRASKTTSFFKLVYNLPSFMLKGLGLDVDPFRNYINVLGLVLFVALIILVVRVFIK